MKRINLAMCALLAAGTAAVVLPSSAPGQYPGGYPGGQQPSGPNPALIEARRQIQEAEKEVVRIRQDMQKIKARISSRYEGKEEWEESAKAVKAAETAHDNARKRAMAKLYASPDYKKAKEAESKADAEVQKLTAQGAKADPNAVGTAQQARIDAALIVRKLETDTLQNDPQVLAAKQKLAEAKKSREALDDELEQALGQDPDYQTAQQELEAAQANVAQMKAGLQQQVAAERQQRRAAQQAERQSRQGQRGAGGYPR